MSNKNAEFKVNIPSFDEIIATFADEKKLEASKKATLKIKKEAKISGLVKAALVKKIEAESALTEALFSEHADEASAVKAVVDATKTYEFYEAIYNSLFPNA